MAFLFVSSYKQLNWFKLQYLSILYEQPPLQDPDVCIDLDLTQYSPLFGKSEWIKYKCSLQNIYIVFLLSNGKFHVYGLWSDLVRSKILMPYTNLKIPELVIYNFE